MNDTVADLVKKELRDIENKLAWAKQDRDEWVKSVELSEARIAEYETKLAEYEEFLRNHGT